MVTFIAGRIMLEADKSMQQGQDKYKAYFVNTSIYHKHKDVVDTILRTDGYTDVIVTT
ncbi:hypothetical protein R6U77_11995 [Lysinibacillus louembei]|uniref:Uncharacterized protein n=1 Tax=Lysinibacillus louembei TaxID=1470088 RepID=A0ABZ0RQW1_9BACI|nr:hypothetical protein [Lysinibacillus louembei]WPK10603.1 hypothetical protein R6U77_11995 [Lysinibacillus louembei]